MADNRPPLDPTRRFSEGGAVEHQTALGIDCPSCAAPTGAWCPMPGTTWNLCGARIWAACAASPDPNIRALTARHPPVDCWSTEIGPAGDMNSPAYKKLRALAFDD